MHVLAVVHQSRTFRIAVIPPGSLPDLSGGGPAFKCWAFSILEEGSPPARARAMTKGHVQVATAVQTTVATSTGLLGVWRRPSSSADDQAVPLGEALLHGLLDAGQQGRFLWGLEEPERPWQGGVAIDPTLSKIYRANAALSADASLLVVRGYAGDSMFGRNQAWHRITGRAA